MQEPVNLGPQTLLPHDKMAVYPWQPEETDPWRQHCHTSSSPQDAM